MICEALIGIAAGIGAALIYGILRGDKRIIDDAPESVMQYEHKLTQRGK